MHAVGLLAVDGAPRAGTEREVCSEVTDGGKSEFGRLAGYKFEELVVGLGL
jgi:hypothetical protein